MRVQCLTALQHVCSSHRSERTLGFISLKAQRSNVPPGFLRMTYQREAPLALFWCTHIRSLHSACTQDFENYVTAVWRGYSRKTFSWQKLLPGSLASFFYPATVLHLKWRQCDSCVLFFIKHFISAPRHICSAGKSRRSSRCHCKQTQRQEALVTEDIAVFSESLWIAAMMAGVCLEMRGNHLIMLWLLCICVEH